MPYTYHLLFVIVIAGAWILFLSIVCARLEKKITKLQEANHYLRQWVNNEIDFIDPPLFDQEEN